MSLMRLKAHGLFRWICYIFIAFVIVEVVVVNFIILMAYLSVKKDIDSILYGKGNTIIDNIIENHKFQNLLYNAKNGGFASLLQETVGRMYVVSYPRSNGEHMKGQPVVSGIGIDTSNSGESLYLYRRIQSRSDFPYQKLIIDVGANDGLISSNSYNFIQWGWSAILVEPQSSELNHAVINSRRHRDPYKDGKQNFTVFNGVLGDDNGFVNFVISSAVDKMESHVMVDFNKEKMKNSDPLIMNVPSLTVMSFTNKYNVPKRFGILSIDAEGLGDKILHQWMKLGFRPAYIVYEQLHNSESIQDTAKYLEQHDYRYLTLLGWNHMFEHIPFPGDDSASDN